MWIERIGPSHIIGAASVFVSAYARPPWSETWSIEAAIENVTDIVGTLDIGASVLSFARQLADLK